jgi:hypothetical protein
MKGFRAEPGEQRPRTPSTAPSIATSPWSAEPTYAATSIVVVSTSRTAAFRRPKRSAPSTQRATCASTSACLGGIDVVSMRLAGGGRDDAIGQWARGTAARRASGSGRRRSRPLRREPRARAVSIAARPNAVDGERACGLCGMTASDSASAAVRSCGGFPNHTQLAAPTPSTFAPYGARLRYASSSASFENASSSQSARTI